MTNERKRNIDHLFEHGTEIDTALAEGVTNALRRHLREGIAAVEVKGKEIVRVSPRRIAARLRANGGK